MKSVEKRLEVRSSWKARLVGTLAGWLIRIYSLTVRFEVVDHCGMTRRDGLPESVAWCFWHNRVLGVAMARLKVFLWRRGAVLTSASHDGAALASAMKVLGVESVRGSSSRRGSAALKELLRVLKSGLDAGVTPDGPRGPRYKMQAGVVKLAQVSRAALVPVHIRYSRAWRLKTWDRFVIPKPFSRCELVFDELLEVPRSLDDDAFEAERLRIEAILRDGVDDLDETNHDDD